MSVRIARSSWSSVAYSLSAYHFADQVRLTPRRKPYGWTLCPMSGLPRFEDDGDVGHRLVDGKGATLGTRLPSLQGGTLVRVGLDDHEVLGREVVVVLGVRGRAREDARDVAGGPLRLEPQGPAAIYVRPPPLRGRWRCGASPCGWQSRVPRV